MPASLDHTLRLINGDLDLLFDDGTGLDLYYEEKLDHFHPDPAATFGRFEPRDSDFPGTLAGTLEGMYDSLLTD